ncbi:PepSY domain-containing protein [Acetobacter sp. DmW_043]|uniref:PepSY-associated TM helix domain-containing protein n=1 Tax=Acetobacter sp. DmW_043 TaxID=1670658 RepID=UPI0013026ACC|nr:PepSY-associated TM helix domain-containing protein [Acetobacter sp. DmW_043]
MRKPVLAVIWPFRRWLAAIVAAHSALGLLCGSFMYLVALSGSVALFSDEIRWWEQPFFPVMTSLKSGSIDVAVADLSHQYPNLSHKLVLIHLPTSREPYTTIAVGEHNADGSKGWYISADGRLVAPVKHEFSEFIVALHTSLIMEHGAGRMLVGIIGIAFLSLIMSGILAQTQIFKNAFTLRVGGNIQLQAIDFHNRIGTWGAPFFLLMALTGSILGLFFVLLSAPATTAYRGNIMQAFTELAGPTSGHGLHTSPEPLSMLLHRIIIDEPESELKSAAITNFGTITELIRITGVSKNDGITPMQIVFDGRGRKLFDSRINNGGASQRFLWFLQPIHYGSYGGLIIKTVYSLFGWGLCFMTSSGMRIWFARRSNRGVAVPKLERLWDSILWGQAFSLCMVAIVALFPDIKITSGMTWLITSIGLGALSIMMRNRERLMTFLMFMGSCALFSTVIIHAIKIYRYSSIVCDIEIMDVILLLIALIMGAYAFIRCFSPLLANKTLTCPPKM